MSAIRLARGFTKRDKIIKFDGCYHGHADSLLVKAGSGALTFGHPDSAGVPAAFTQHTIVVPFNDADAVKAAFEANQGQVAGIIVEPVPGNAGVYLPKPGYLEFLRKITADNGALLIFDEVMTGFRLAWGGAQERFGIRPDLTCFGKIIGGGLPVGAFGGRSDIMDCLAPLGPVYQAGTLSGNPLAMAAGIAALEELRAALTPALSHRMGEGELSPARGKASARPNLEKAPQAVPSPGAADEVSVKNKSDLGRVEGEHSSAPILALGNRGAGKSPDRRTDSDWRLAGVWYLAGANTCVYSNPKEELGDTQHVVQTSNRRFRDDEFIIPRDLTRGRSAIRVRVQFTPVNIPLFPGQPLPEPAWSEIRYDAYCWVMPESSVKP